MCDKIGRKMSESPMVFCWICGFLNTNGDQLYVYPVYTKGCFNFCFSCMCFLGDKRAFIISRVLVSRSVQGHNRMRIPPPGIDTTVGNGKVCVKFGDNEVLPTYVIYFKCDNNESRQFAKLSHVKPHNSFLESQYCCEFDVSDHRGDIMKHLSPVAYTRSIDVAARPPHTADAPRTTYHYHRRVTTTPVRPTLRPSPSPPVTSHWSQTTQVRPRVQPTPPPSSAFSCLIL